VIIFENHLHLRRDGRFLDAVRDFHQVGGTHFVLCQYPMPHLVIKDKSYKKCYQETLKMAEEIRIAVPVNVYVTVGPYPVDYLKFKELFGRDQAMVLMKQGIDEAVEICQKQQAIAIGEIGRPHFPVDQQTIIDSNSILQYGMEQAKDIDVPIVVHTESTTIQQCKDLVDLAKTVGLSPEKLVKHFSPPFITSEENHGLIPSVLASKKNIQLALQKGSRFLMETDYIDDSKRPGAVLGPKTIPKLTKKLLDAGQMSDQQADEIHVTLPKQVYNLDLIEK